jgi:hypothetical protein
VGCREVGALRVLLRILRDRPERTSWAQRVAVDGHGGDQWSRSQLDLLTTFVRTVG